MTVFIIYNNPMISEKQLEQLDNLLGKCLRLSISIEYTVNSIYCYIKTINEPIVYQDKDINIIKNDKFDKLWFKAQHLNFENSLNELKKLDKDYNIFSESQYHNLHKLRKDRNTIFHETTCPYLTWKASQEETEEEYEKDVKRLKSYISFAMQYDKVTKKVLDNLFKLKESDNPLEDIKIVSVKTYKF